MTTFTLVHGAFHGAWCWELLVPELERRGASAVAMDLPCDDAGSGIEEYAASVITALAGTDHDDIVVVGHSMAGLVAPVVADRLPCRRLVLLAALIPEPGGTALVPAMDEAFLAAARPGDDGLLRFAPELATQWFFHDCSPEVAKRAAGSLRPQGTRPAVEPSPLARWPDVPLSYVLCREDRVVDPRWSGQVVRERFGVVPHELAGSHSPFLSRPAELAELLVGL